MKRIVLTLIGIAMILQIVQCSTATTQQKAAPTDPVVESGKKKCAASYGRCIQKADNNKSKKSACTNRIVKCSAKCDTKAKGYKKTAPEKIHKSYEI